MAVSQNQVIQCACGASASAQMKRPGAGVFVAARGRVGVRSGAWGRGGQRRAAGWEKMKGGLQTRPALGTPKTTPYTHASATVSAAQSASMPRVLPYMA